MKEGAAKVQTLHEAQTSAAPGISLIRVTRPKRVRSSTVRVSRARRARRVRAPPCRIQHSVAFSAHNRELHRRLGDELAVLSDLSFRHRHPLSLAQ